MDDDQEYLSGKTLKVLSVDDDTGTVYGRAQDGLTTQFIVIDGPLPARGDIILLGPNRWIHAPAETWVVSSSIATVRSILDEGDVVLDDGLSIKTIKNHKNVGVSVHNTVEFNEIDGIVRIIAEKPIRSREYGTDRDDVLREFLVDTSAGGPSFSSFGGYPEVVGRARELIETQLDRRPLLDEIGARPVRGVLFTGPPGTGKTHLARIIAHEANADFYLVSGPSIVSKWVGDTEDTLRKIFDAASTTKSGRAIIFFDEIDSIAERRTGESHEASKRLVAQLLTLMDGFAEVRSSVVVIAATNRVQSLDPALTRPGRFDWEIEFPIPSLFDRCEILTVQAERLNTASWLPIHDIAMLTGGWSAAELNALWVEAALTAAGEGRGFIAAEDLALAYERVARRPRRRSGEE